MRTMRKSDKQNAIVVATIALCFMVTLGACYMFSGDGILKTFFAKRETSSYYILCSGTYDDIALARASADIIKARGGAGYIIQGEQKEVVLSVYSQKAQAESVQGKMDSAGSYIKEITMPAISLDWADKTYRFAIEEALGYFDLCYDSLTEISNSLSVGSISVDDANLKIKVLRTQIEDIKFAFYQNVSGYEKPQITETKLALVTAAALVDNVVYSTSTPQTVSSVRYQLVQLVYCRQALLASY